MKKSELITLIRECIKEVIKEDVIHERSKLLINAKTQVNKIKAEAKKLGLLNISESVKPYSSLNEYNTDLDKMIFLAKQLIKK